jgi:nitric oxide reductase subunit B
MTTKRLWLGLALVMGISFAVLIFFGTDIYRQAPPIPNAVVSASGDTSFF